MKKIILDIDEFGDYLLKQFEEDEKLWRLPSESNMVFHEFIFTSILVPLEQVYEKRRLESAKVNGGTLTERIAAAVKEKKKINAPNIDWDKMPMLLNKRDIARYLSLQENLINKWIKAGKIRMHSKLGARKYAITEELKEDIDKIYAELH